MSAIAEAASELVGYVKASGVKKVGVDYFEKDSKRGLIGQYCGVEKSVNSDLIEKCLSNKVKRSTEEMR